MLVILEESVRGLGIAGQAVEVKPGYGRFLIRYNKAKEGTKRNLSANESRIAILKKENQDKIDAAKAMVDSLIAKRFVIVRQAGDDNRLFGSVTSRDFAKMLADDGFDVHYRSISFGNPIKYLGKYSVNVELHAEVVVQVVLYVVRSESDVVKLELEEKKAELAASEKNKAFVPTESVKHSEDDDGASENSSS